MGMTGGKGGKSSGESLLEGTVRDLSSETKPIREVLSSQYLEALNTGGIGARIPIITAMQDQSRMGTANALRGTSDQLATAGLARTPYAASILANTRLQGDTATAMIPSQVASGFISGAPQYAMAPVGAMIGGAGSLASTQANRDIAKGNQQTQLYSSLIQASASAAASAGGGGGCWIARRLFGDTSAFYGARYFIFHRWRGRSATLARWAYLRWGARAARWRWITVLRPAFAVAARRGLA